MDTKFDLHLSAYRIGVETVREIESCGFTRDEFANNTRCDATVYHATHRHEVVLPDDALWDHLARVLREDDSFVGALEEERCEPADVIYLTGTSRDAPPVCGPLQMTFPPAGQIKTCDIHIRVHLGNTTTSALGCIQAMELASFDRPHDNEIHRIFSATCENQDSGKLLFCALSSYLSRVPGLVGRMKFEYTTRVLRLPSSAPALPLANDVQLTEWLSKQALNHV
jgi:hypothetical protein